jgi:hypothetical protein
MRILFDECVPEAQRLGFTRCTVETVGFRGWKGIANGELLSRAVEALVTADRLL